MKLNLLYRLFRSVLWWIALVLISMVSLLNVLYISRVASTGYEIVFISGHLMPGVLMLALIGCLLIFLHFFREKLEKIRERKLFWLMAAIYGVLAAYLIFNVDNTIRADAKSVFQAALELKEGIYSAFQPGYYLYRYPHQLGLLLYDQVITEFSPNPLFSFFVNYLLVLGINHTSWRISEELFHDTLTNVVTIFLSFAFLPQLFFILFAYGLIPGFLFMLLGFYYCLRFSQRDSLRDLLAMLLCVAVAVTLKQNFLIGGIAIAIFLFLRFLQEKKRWNLVIIGILALCMLLPGSFLKLWYGHQVGVKLDNASPSVLWIAMGTDIDNGKRGAGWYDSSVWNLYNDAVYDAEIASELGKQKLERNWEKIQSDPHRARQFFLDKTISQWCDPMYESVWSGPLEDCGQYTHTKILQSLYTGGTWADIITDYMKLLCLMLWIFATVFLLLYGKSAANWEPMYLYFIGGLLFHTIWEAKSQYTYPYLFVLIPFAAFGIKKIITMRK